MKPVKIAPTCVTNRSIKRRGGFGELSKKREQTADSWKMVKYQLQIRAEQIDKQNAGCFVCLCRIHPRLFCEEGITRDPFAFPFYISSATVGFSCRPVNFDPLGSDNARVKDLWDRATCDVCPRLKVFRKSKCLSKIYLNLLFAQR